jgi:phosphatidate cytidylyltransferase
LTGLAGAPLIVLIIGFGQKAGLLLLIVLAITLGLIEFFRLTCPEDPLWKRTAKVALGLFLPVAAYFGQGEMLLAAMALVPAVLFLLFAAKPENLRLVTWEMAVTLVGIVCVSFLLSHILLLRNQPMGVRWVLFLLITVWAGDTVAYFTGTWIGRHKLYPKISPGKTVEGLLGGLGGSIIAALLFRRLFFEGLASGYVLVLAFFIMILGQIGDFWESTIKRSANVKDSSRLIPGHGGMLDRLDSFLFAAPFVYYYVAYLNR